MASKERAPTANRDNENGEPLPICTARSQIACQVAAADAAHGMSRYPSGSVVGQVESDASLEDLADANRLSNIMRRLLVLAP